MQRLNFAALLHNANYFKKLLRGARLCAVVKNDAYGHGAEHVARYLEEVADCFAVGTLDEAMRISFVKKDILILLPIDESDCEKAINKNCILTVDSFCTLNAVLRVTSRLNKKARIHIKINSGMSRLGFNENDLEKLINIISNCRDLIVEGVYSHFYGDNIKDCDNQYAVFCPVAESLEKALNKKLIKHIANSNGALLSSKYHLDMARIGLGLYGYGQKNLQSVKTVNAKVIAVRQIKKGDVAGYGGLYVAPCSKTIAVINVGYAHGFNRALVGAHIKINGVMCTVVAVCMAMILVDVSSVITAEGDEVILLGDRVDISNKVISIYELLCNLK